MDFRRASDIAYECMEVLSKNDAEMVLELQIASGMPSCCTLIDWAHLFRGDPRCLIGSSGL